MHKHSRSRKLLAEFAGTFAIVLVCTAISQSPAFSIFYGIVFAAAFIALGRISGGHFNPAVTIGFWVTHRFGFFKTLLYVAAQLGGAAAAAYSVRLFVSQDMWNFLMPGALTLSAGTTRGPAMLIEAAITFPLVFTLCVLTMDKLRARHWLVGLAAGVVITTAAMFGAPYTGGVMNPALAFGPALAARQWAYQGVYWVGPLAGGVAAASLYDLIFRRSPGAAQGVPEKTSV
jgi:glycerol uptake facilitator-like aquaporin